MYVAQKQLKVTDPKTKKLVLIEPGQEVVGFESWPEIPKRAHLNLDYVREVADQRVPDKPKLKPKKKG